MVALKRALMAVLSASLLVGLLAGPVTARVQVTRSIFTSAICQGIEHFEDLFDDFEDSTPSIDNLENRFCEDGVVLSPD